MMISYWDQEANSATVASTFGSSRREPDATRTSDVPCSDDTWASPRLPTRCDGRVSPVLASAITEAGWGPRDAGSGRSVCRQRSGATRARAEHERSRRHWHCGRSHVGDSESAGLARASCTWLLYRRCCQRERS